MPALDLGPSERRAVARFVDRVASFHGIDDRVEVWNGAAGSVGPSDLVVSFAVAAAGDRERQLQSVAALARKVLIVVERNPERLGAWTRSRERRADALATVRTLWELGRVRDHEYIGIPLLIATLAGVSPDSAPSTALRGPSGAVARRSASLHAFAVDVTPRTRQARRRLRLEQSP